MSNVPTDTLKLVTPERHCILQSGASVPNLLQRTPALFSLVALAALLNTQALEGQSIVGPARKGEPARVRLRTPEEHFGFQMGADQKLAHWDDMVKYYDLLASTSDRMKVVNMGKTSEGRPVLRVVHLLAGQPREPRGAAADQRNDRRSARRA